MVAEAGIAQGIPEELADYAADMAKTCSISSVDRSLRQLAEERGLRQNWTADYLRNHFRPGNRGSSESTCSEILQELEARKERTGLQHFVDADGEDVVDRIWFELEGGAATWSTNVKTNVVLFDPTWGTNDEGFKLCCFTTIGATGETEIIAACLLKTETEFMFEWAFRCFATVFKTPPLNFYSDGDEKIANAIKTLQEPATDDSGTRPGPWAGVNHRLCVYHLSKNFFKHIKPLFGSDLEGWKESIDLFWKIAKESDSRSVDYFDDDWLKLETVIEVHAEDTPAREAALVWLEGLKGKKDKFCLRFVWQSCTWGIHSTQRAESMQSKIKKQCCPSNRLKIRILIVELDRLNVQSRSKKAVETALLQAKQSVLNSSTPILEFLQKHINPYALKLVYEQAREAGNYLSKETTDELNGEIEEGAKCVYRRNNIGLEVLPSRRLDLVLDDEGNIDWSQTPALEDFGLDEVSTSRLTTLKSCSCQFPTAFGGLPCRHMQHLYTVSMTTDFQFLLTNIEHKWRIVQSKVAQQRLCELRMRPSPFSCPVLGRAPQGMSRAKRYQELSLLFEALADVATANDGAFDKAAEGMRGLIERVINAPYVTPSAAHAASSARWEAPAANAANKGRDTIGADAADLSPTCTPHDATEGATTSVKTSHVDEVSLKEVLGVTLKSCPIAPTEYEMAADDWWETLLNKPMAYKEKGQGQGGWHSGLIIAVRVNQENVIKVPTFDDIVYPDNENEQDEDEDGEDENSSSPSEDSNDEAVVVHAIYDDDELMNFVPEGSVIVHFQASNTWEVIKLTEPTYAKMATARIRSWMLLQTRPLGRSSADVRDPPKRLKRGRPAKQRNAPAAGPTSRRRKRKQGAPSLIPKPKGGRKK